MADHLGREKGDLVDLLPDEDHAGGYEVGHQEHDPAGQEYLVVDGQHSGDEGAYAEAQAAVGGELAYLTL